MRHPFLLKAILFSGVAMIINVFSGFSQTFSVSGRIISSQDKNGIPGVTVSVPGTSKGTVSDASGKYRLTDISAKDSLAFSSIGYLRQTIAVKGRSLINITLSPNVSELNQLVVIGYGTAKRKDLTGAISSVNAARLQNQDPQSVQDILRANVPGLSVGFSTGAQPGGGLQVRGKNTLNAGSSPLIVLDGVIYYGSLSDINPDDIASIDVLKDASAAAVYGAKAAEGVIAITTKRGQTGKPTINFNANYGVATMEVNQRPYGPSGFIKFREDVQYSRNVATAKPYEFSDPRKLPSDISLNQWMAYDGSSGDPVTVWFNRLNMQPVELANYKAGKSVDWYNIVFHNGIQQNYTLSLSGKSDAVSYYISGGYLKNEGVVVGDKFSTVNTRVNLQAEVTRFLTVGMHTMFADRDQSAVPINWNEGITNSPLGSIYTDDSSNYRYSPNDQNGIGEAANPLPPLKYTDRLNKYYTLNSTIFGELKLPFGFTYKVNFTPLFEWHQYFNHVSSHYVGSSAASQGGTAERLNSLTYQWQIDNLLTWSKTFNNIHHLDLTLLSNAEKYQSWSDDMTNSLFNPNDNLGYHDIGAGVNPIISSDDEYSTGAALMARLFYSLEDRYLVTLSVRRDGYSAFGQKYPWGTFPSAAVGWVFTQEPFFKSDWLDFGKLRLSYGVNGNRDIGRYIALAYLQTGKYLHVTSNGATVQVSQLYVNNMPNPNLKWEQTASLDAGLDFTLLHDKMNGSIDVYKSKTTNLLVERRLPNVLGFDFVWTNLGEVDNKGLEIDLNSHNITHQDFSWNSSVTFSLNRNQIVHLYGDKIPIDNASGKVVGYQEVSDTTNKWFIGHAIDAIWDQKTVGIWQTGQAAEAAKYGQSPGDFHVEDVNKDGHYTNADRMFLGYTSPRFRWTLTNEFTLFRRLTLSFLIYSYWGQMGTYNQAKNNSGFLDRTSWYNLPYWTADHPENTYARLYSSDGSANYNVYRRKSFIRLDNVALGYSLPGKALKRIHAEGLKFYFTVKHAAFYAPDWEFWDPENSGPTPRTYVLGVNLTL